ncbi:MAG: AAA family ATPase [Caldilineaceae bacterium]
MSTQVAGVNLNQLHHDLVDALPAAEHWLLLTPESWQWQPDVQFQLDVAAFEQLLAKVEHTPEPTHRCAELQEAVSLYVGDLLPACSDPWILELRARLRRQLVECLRLLVGLLEDQGDYLAAVTYARRLWQHDPLAGAEVERLVRLHVLHGERAGALQALQRRVEAAVRGRGGLIFIEGPAGIGKTTLALACQKHAAGLGAVFVVSHCHERGVLPPFQPWQELLAALEQAMSLELRSLPGSFGQEATVQSAHQLMRAVTAWLRTAAASRPLVLLLDDLHCADPDSLDLLDYVTRHLADASCLVIATYRSEEIQRDRPLYELLPNLKRNRPTDVIRLAPLNEADTVRLVDACYGPCSPHLASYLHNRSEGQPLFLMELLNHLVEQKLLVQDALGRWFPPDRPVPIPPLLQQVILGRVARLGEQVEAFLAVAAVAGERWELAVVEGALAWPEDTLLTVLEQVLAANLVGVLDEHRELYHFTHGLIREVLYHRQVGRRRKHLHARIAELIEAHAPPDTLLAPMARDEHIAQLAYHFYAAEKWGKALQYNREAGDAAGTRCAAHSALQFYTQALDAAHRASTVAGAAVLLAIYERLGEVHTMLNHKEQAEVAFTHMLEAARSIDERQAESRALCQLSILQGWLNRLSEARSTGITALHIAEQAGDAHLLALAHFNLGHLDVIVGELAHASQHLEQAEQLAYTASSHSILARSLQNQVYVATFTGRYGEAVQLAAAAVAAAETSHDAMAVSGAYRALGQAQVELGYYTEARRALQAGLGSAEESGESHYLAKLLNTMGFLHNELGDGTAALQWDKQALAACRRPDLDRNWEAESYTLLNLASDELLIGRIKAATDHKNEVETILDRAHMSRYRFLNRYYLFCAELALANGDPHAALHSAAEAAKMAQTHGVTKNMAKSLLCEGQALLRLGRINEAAQCLERAVTLADSIRHGSLRWKTRLRLAEAYALWGRPHGEFLNQALDLVTRIANSLDDDHMRAAFLAWPLIIELKSNARSAAVFAQPLSPDPSPTSEYPVGLTDREVAVLRLVAHGATNRQIAATLFISVKTVNAHMTNILNKINCDNRTAATTFAIQHGLVE